MVNKCCLNLLDEVLLFSLPSLLFTIKFCRATLVDGGGQLQRHKWYGIVFIPIPIYTCTYIFIPIDIYTYLKVCIDIFTYLKVSISITIGLYLYLYVYTYTCTGNIPYMFAYMADPVFHLVLLQSFQDCLLAKTFLEGVGIPERFEPRDSPNKKSVCD